MNSAEFVRHDRHQWHNSKAFSNVPQHANDSYDPSNTYAPPGYVLIPKEEHDALVRLGFCAQFERATNLDAAESIA